MTIAITGGGTGGHLIIAKVIAQELNLRGIRCIFIGSTYGQDQKWFANSELFYIKIFFQSSGVVNKKGLKKLSSLFNIFKFAFQCKKIFKSQQIQAVISVGGYSSAPAAFAALFTHTPLFIHEQNAIKGRLNSLLKNFAKCFYSSYEEPKFDYPVDDKFFKTARIRNKFETIIFLGGSQGAKFINDLALNLAIELKNLDINIIHQCGEKDFMRVKTEYEKLGINIRLVGFCANLEELMKEADLCISRSGASTLWELCANLLPAIFIPYAHAAGDHQYYNAKFLQDSKLAKIIKEENITKEVLLEIIKNYDIASISRRLVAALKEDGVGAIVDDIIENLKKNNIIE